MAMFPEDVFYAVGGQIKTAALFKETCRDCDTPIFTLSSRNKEGLINLRSLYLDLCEDDPTEYEFAITVFGDVVIWNTITKAQWMREALAEWKETAAIRRKSKAFKTLVNEVKNKGKNSLAAAKILIDEPWENKKGVATKRRSYNSTKKALESVDSDIERLRQDGLLN